LNPKLYGFGEMIYAYQPALLKEKL